MFKRALTLTVILGLSVAPALGQERKKKAAVEEETKVEVPAVAEKPAPYDPKLMRLAEILGSVSYLRNLCKGSESEWREMMQELLGEETTSEPQRAARLTAAFNRGYRSFAATYVKCTPQAIAAEEAYRAEGATLATEITARFGN